MKRTAKEAGLVALGTAQAAAEAVKGKRKVIRSATERVARSATSAIQSLAERGEQVATRTRTQSMRATGRTIGVEACTAERDREAPLRVGSRTGSRARAATGCLVDRQEGNVEGQVLRQEVDRSREIHGIEADRSFQLEREEVPRRDVVDREEIFGKGLETGRPKGRRIAAVR